MKDGRIEEQAREPAGGTRTKDEEAPGNPHDGFGRNHKAARADDAAAHRALRAPRDAALRRQRAWRIALAACIVGLVAVIASGVTLSGIAGDSAVQNLKSGGPVLKSLRVEVLSVDEDARTMRVRALPWPDEGIYSAWREEIAAGEEGEVSCQNVPIGAFHPLPGDDAVVSWVESSRTQAAFPLSASDVNSAAGFFQEEESSGSESQETQREMHEARTSPAFPTNDDNPANQELKGAYACDMLVEVTAYDSGSKIASVRAILVDGGQSMGARYSIAEGTQGNVRINAYNFRYGSESEAGDELVLSWITSGSSLSAYPGVVRTPGDFWYETARPWPQEWLDAAQEGTFTHELISATPAEALFAADEG